MLGKKKSDLVNVLDELRSEQPKKRLLAVAELREVASAIGPQRVRSELIAFLGEFVDDDDEIILQLLGQLSNFAELLGGAEHEKCLLPLLISFCKTDEKKQAFLSCDIIARILTQNKDLALDTIRKLAKTEMTIAKECAAKLISSLISLLEPIQPALLELYASLVNCENPVYRIIASRYLNGVLAGAKQKAQIGNMLEFIYGENEDLAKIHALGVLVNFYAINSNLTLSKFKALAVTNSWRINIKICELTPLLLEKISKAHFKLVFQPLLLKFLVSTQPELRAASCLTLPAIAKSCSQDQLKSKFLPALKKMAEDSEEFVKVQFSKNLISVCPYLPPEAIKESVLPIVFQFVKERNCQISLGVLKGFDYISSKISKEILEEKIITPLTSQLETNNWRLKCQIILILQSIIQNPIYLTDKVIKVLLALTDDKIDAVRLQVNNVIIGIIKKASVQWCQAHFLPRVKTMQSSPNYIKRQNWLQIIDKTAGSVSERTLKEVYQNAVLNGIADKVPNVRMKTAQIVKNNLKMLSPIVDKVIDKLKDDKDVEVREMSKKLRA